MVYPVLTNEEMTTESHSGINSFIKNAGNAIPKHAGPEAKGSNPTTGLTLLWARNPMRGNLTTGKSHGKKPDNMRRTAGYTWTDYKTNAEIEKELKITPILDKLLEYKRSWIKHVNRMS